MASNSDESMVYSGDPNQMIGRYLINTFGVQELAIMPKIHWDYYDWLLRIGADMSEFTVRCDQARKNIPLGEALQAWLFDVYEHREQEKLPRPAWMPPLIEF